MKNTNKLIIIMMVMMILTLAITLFPAPSLGQSENSPTDSNPEFT